MADNKSKRGGPDRRRVAANEPYEVGYFARKHDISREQAQRLITRIGGDREKLNAAAAKLKPAASSVAAVRKAVGKAATKAVRTVKAAISKPPPRKAAAKKR